MSFTDTITRILTTTRLRGGDDSAPMNVPLIELEQNCNALATRPDVHEITADGAWSPPEPTEPYGYVRIRVFNAGAKSGSSSGSGGAGGGGAGYFMEWHGKYTPSLFPLNVTVGTAAGQRISSVTCANGLTISNPQDAQNGGSAGGVAGGNGGAGSSGGGGGGGGVSGSVGGAGGVRGGSGSPGASTSTNGTGGSGGGSIATYAARPPSFRSGGGGAATYRRSNGAEYGYGGTGPVGAGAAGAGGNGIVVVELF